MYDFYFGDLARIEKDPLSLLLAVKRMLPRWANGIPDSQFVAIYNLLDSFNPAPLERGKMPVLMETGSGASTIVLAYFAIRWKTRLYSWDSSGSKLSYLRGVLTETLFNVYRDCNPNATWNAVAYASTSPHAGIPMLSELGEQVCFAFFDSDHTWNTLGAELDATLSLLAPEAIVALDDATYAFTHVNTAYVNMIRAKQGLKPAQIADNEGASFKERTERVLVNRCAHVTDLEGGTFPDQAQDDIFWRYYDLDRKNMYALGMEQLENLKQRFAAWRIVRD
ncbi:MAG: class I SAM-dependent methyltransferase [Pseudomonadota bacterium]